MYLSDHPLKKFEFELDTFTSCKLSEVDDIIAECNKTKTMRKLNLAGLITSVETKQSKTGRPYAKSSWRTSAVPGISCSSARNTRIISSI